MRGKPFLVVFMICLAVTLVARLIHSREKEPSYEGKPLSYWFNAIDTRSHFVGIHKGLPAVQAIDAMGESAVPFLIQHFRPKSRQRFICDRALRWVKHSLNIPVEEEWKRQQKRAHDADKAFGLLSVMGSKAQSAVPALLDMAADPQVLLSNRELLLVLLGSMRPPTEKLVPVLVQCLPQKHLRFRAITVLGQCGQSASAAAPYLEPCLNDADIQVSAAASAALIAMNEALDLAIPQARTILSSKPETCRRDLLHLMKSAGSTSGVPVFIEALINDDQQTRIVATNALKQIDPEAAAKAGIQ